eukprot:c6463_g1_i1 orf=315-995(-)
MATPVSQTKLLLVVFPLLVLASDLYTLFLAPPNRSESSKPGPAASPPYHHRDQHRTADEVHPVISGSSNPVTKVPKVDISFCTSCSYRKTAIQVQNMLINSFPGIEVMLSNYPPPLAKQILIKLVPLIQFGGIGLAFWGEHIFPRLGYTSPPSWYNTLRQNRFGTAATCWLVGNILQNSLQSTGAFEVSLNGDLLFSKLKDNRFPEEFELRDLVASALERQAARIL